MPYKNKADQVACSKRYFEQNKAKMMENSKIYKSKWRLTPEGAKKTVLEKWKRRGINDEDIDSVYDYYITQTHCWICDIKYDKKHKRCLDHDHTKLVNNCRYICCNSCNSWTVG